METIYSFMARTTVKMITIFVLLFFTTQHAKAVCPVTANFTYQINGNTVEFSPVQQADTLTTFYWNFGDGNYIYQNGTVSHTYINAGNYNAILSVRGQNVIDTSIHCGEAISKSIFIQDSLPCLHKNTIINQTLYYPNNNNGISFCADYNSCLFPNNFMVIGNANHGNVSNISSGCFEYNVQSVGNDTLKIVSCNAINNCDTTTFQINIQQRTECNQIPEDTVYLQLYSTEVSYCTPYSSGRYFFINDNPNYYNPYFTCAPNNLSIQFFQAGINNITIIDSLNNCFENVVFIVVDSIRECQQSNSIVIRDTFYQNQVNTNRTYCLPFLCSQRPNAQIAGTVEYGNTYFSVGCFNYFYTSIGADSFYIEYSGVGPYKDTIYFYFTTSSSDSVELCDTITCLLPGDADHDLAVNNYDVFALGLSYNRMGSVRPNATTQYTLQASPNWNTTHYYGYNDKFADCNGDGIINATDALVVDQNYIVQAQNHFNHRLNQIDTLPSITLAFDTLPSFVVNGNCDAAELVADINVGSVDQPLTDGYGIAFSVNYPFDNDSCFSVSVELDANSWFQNNNPVLFFYKNIPQYKRVDISVVRTDGVPSSGNGRIGRIKLITEGGIFRGGRLSTPKILDFSVADVAVINQYGQRIDVNGSSTTVSFVVAGVKQNKVDGLQLYPNPTSSKIYINAKENIESIRVIDLSGRVIKEFMPNKFAVEMDFSSTENGMYIIEIKGDNSVSYEKIFKQ